MPFSLPLPLFSSGISPASQLIINPYQYRMRREFTSTYEQAIALIKQLKNSNDHLNRAIGVDPHPTILSRLAREQPLITATTANIEGLIQKLEQSYLDPDTARKIGTAKQQFRIQRDRRNQLLQSANYDEAPAPTPAPTFANPFSQINHEEPSSSRLPSSPRQASSKGHSSWNPFNHKQSEITSTSQRHERQDKQQQVEMEMEAQFERKLMHERKQQIDSVAKSIMNVHNILQETAVLAHEQGEQLDVIGQELFTTYRNVDLARENINEANQSQQRARRKYVYLSMIILVVLAVAAVLVFV